MIRDGKRMDLGSPIPFPFENKILFTIPIPNLGPAGRVFLYPFRNSFKYPFSTRPDSELSFLTGQVEMGRILM